MKRTGLFTNLFIEKIVVHRQTKKKCRAHEMLVIGLNSYSNSPLPEMTFKEIKHLLKSHGYKRINRIKRSKYSEVLTYLPPHKQ